MPGRHDAGQDRDRWWPPQAEDVQRDGPMGAVESLGRGLLDSSGTSPAGPFGGRSLANPGPGTAPAGGEIISGALPPLLRGGFALDGEAAWEQGRRNNEAGDDDVVGRAARAAEASRVKGLKERLAQKKATLNDQLAARADRHTKEKARGNGDDTPDALSDEEDRHRHRRGRSRKRRRRSRGRRSRSSSRSSGSSGADQSLFHKASSGGRIGSKFQEVHRRQPGRLLVRGFETMRKHLDPKMVGGGEKNDTGGLDGCATAYTVNVVNNRGQQLSQRNERELRTLATGLDALAGGRLAELGDVMMQRYKAVEMASQENNWDVAQRLEVIPDARPSALSTEERHAAANHEMSELKLHKLMDSSRTERRNRKSGDR